MKRVIAQAWLLSRTLLPEATFAALDPRQRRTMSRAAELATACALRLGLSGPQPDLAFYMSVGAASGDMREVDGIIKNGLDTAHPLYAFALMNNFTHAHPSIALQAGGPNATFYRDTLAALEEALLCPGRVVVGAADTALHSVMRAELPADFDAAEGAALLLLDDEEGPGVWITGTQFVPPAGAPRNGNALCANAAVAWAQAAEERKSGNVAGAIFEVRT